MTHRQPYLPFSPWQNQQFIQGGSHLSLMIAIIGIGCLVAFLPIRIAGLAILGTSLGLATLINPRLAFYLLIPAIPFNTVAQVRVGGANIGPMEGLLGLMLISWLLQMMVQQRVIVPHPPLLMAYLLFLAVLGLSWLNTISIKSSLIETVKWTEMLVLSLFIWANFRGKAICWIVGLLLLAGLAEASLGLYQFFFKIGPEGFLLFGGRFLRAYGTFRQPNPFAGYLGLILPLGLSVSLWFIGNYRNSAQKLAQLTQNQWYLVGFIGTVGTTGVLLAGLLASQSRGALLGFIGAAAITILLMGGRWTLAAIVAAIIGATVISLGGLAYLPTTITARFVDALPFLSIPDIAQIRVTDANFAIVERLAHWQAAREMWQEHFWMGVGIGNYEVVYPVYAIGPWLDPLGHAHNYLLNLGAETGLIGLLGYLIFWGWVIGYAGLTLLKTQPGQFERAVVAGCLGILVHLHIHNLLDNLYVQGMYLHIGIILSLITLLNRDIQLYNVSHLPSKSR